MLTRLDEFIYRDRYDAMLREAEARRLANFASAGQPSLLSKVSIQLGRMLISIGLRLAAKDGKSLARAR